MHRIERQATSENDGLWTARTAAHQAGFESPVTVLRAWKRGELNAYKFNSRSVRFARKDVLEWIARARATAKGGGK